MCHHARRNFASANSPRFSGIVRRRRRLKYGCRRKGGLFCLSSASKRGGKSRNKLISNCLCNKKPPCISLRPASPVFAFWLARGSSFEAPRPKLFAPICGYLRLFAGLAKNRRRRGKAESQTPKDQRSQASASRVLYGKTGRVARLCPVLTAGGNSSTL